ncbi:sulfite exporter TauE/SafE family protein [Actinomadura sp. DC4]|uniref:sulfite exporter TauE/SafE family protein n=1 Tax=Actinomadura sp. DC4 TaxID=3055069 RepID=UPI0025B0EFDA|nr:sulfite exporter TauE/SafE family protein [Actinomadura sp. DC4]MDN3354575.1 sulfite exporter TauE/SafE family protein [Actinomadura sp. DC4]
MTPLHALTIFATGLAAGCINVIVGSGSLITFPVLIALGYPPVVANVSNTVGLVPGAASGAYGYRRELIGQHTRLLSLGSASVIGAIIGGLLLLVLPEETFEIVVPALIAIACVLVVIQPRLSAWLGGRTRRPHGGPWLWIGVLATGVYGGYFGAAQGFILMALMAIFLDEDLQRVNAVKNVLAGVVNGSAAVLFIFVAHVDWAIVACIAAGSVLGGLAGASIGRRLPATALRVLIVIVGVTAIVKLLA